MGETALERTGWAEGLPAHCGWSTPMQSAAWLVTCYDRLYSRAEAERIEVEGGFAPFARRGWFAPTLYLAGAEELSEPIEPLVADAAAARRLAEAVLARRRAVQFGHLPADGPFTTAFIEAARGRGLLFDGAVGGCPVMRIDAGWKDPLSQLSRRRRSDFRRMQRRAEELGAVEITHLAPTPDAVPALLDRAFAIEARGWKARSRTALIQDPAQAGVLADFGRRAAAEGRLRLAFLTIGGEDAAMQIMGLWDGALWLHKIGYDERFAKASPGMLLLLDVVREAAEAGLDRVEFLGKDAPWTAFWSEELRPLTRLRYYPRNLPGMAALARDGVQLATRRLIDKWRARAPGGEE